MIKNLLGDDETESASAEPTPSSTRTPDGVLGLFDDPVTTSADPKKSEDFVISTAEPQSIGETMRQHGLAWSAGVAFFGAVLFMLILGWGADVLLGTSPWGKVGGIILGSIIGFVQFFRLTSQIFKK